MNVSLALALVASCLASPLPEPTTAAGPAHPQDRILVQFRPGVAPEAVAHLHAKHPVELLRTYQAEGRLQLLKVPEPALVPGLLRQYRASDLVEFAEPDHRVQLARTTPNDPHFAAGLLWALDNTGQFGGTADADIDAPETWDTRTSASNVIVAVVDTGVRYTHEDLAGNMWSHPIDNSHGLNAPVGSNNPMDDSGHGTLIAGVIGAIGHNAKGVVGVAWQTRLMACKFADNTGGYISDAIACLEYARTNGARVINLSWGGYEASLSLSNALREVRQAGMIVVAAAGNDAVDNDWLPYYPASFDFDHIVAVAATTRRDELYALSNVGARNVDLAAPGEQILSTAFGSDAAYAGDAGTSMAAAYVSGACALLCARFPSESPQQILQRLMEGTDAVPALAGLCVSGGRLNVRKALGTPAEVRLRAWPLAGASSPVQLELSGEPGRAYVLQATTNLTDWIPIYTNVTAGDGKFVFTPGAMAVQPQPPGFYRARSAP